jgi:two-component system OmpR family response regulator
MRILIVEDEVKLAEVIAKGLTTKGYAVDIIHDGLEALRRILIHRKDYDLIVLDLMLPNLSGEQICMEMRRENVNIPILILTARHETNHKVNLLTAGADDYLVKPFSFNELLARMEAILRRPPEAVATVLTSGDIKLDPAQHTVRHGGTEVSLTLKEFRLLEYFLRHPNEVIDREDLLTHLWDFNYEGFSNIIDVHVKNLRKKIDKPNAQSVLETVRGIGYRLRQ